MLNYVYLHYDEDEVVYVGMGKGGRCWDTHGSRRNVEHLKWLNTQLPYLKYEIVSTSENRPEILKLERELIKRYSPKFNIGHSRELKEEEIKAHRVLMLKINNQQKHCTHCNQRFSLGMFSRWHGDKCKQKEN